MYEKVIKYLLSTVRAKHEHVSDKTGVLTQFTKDEAARDIVEFEQAIVVLRNCGTQSASDNNGSTPCRFFSRENIATAGEGHYQSVPWCNHGPSQRAMP